MLLITIILLVVLFYWRLFVVKDLNLLTTVFWIIFPDLASFIPIGLAMRGAKEWPHWGPGLYNFFHTLLVWIPVFAVWSILSGAIQWPLLGWAGHITADRSVGYYLRAAKAESIRTYKPVVWLTGLPLKPECSYPIERLLSLLSRGDKP